jgi:plastocyanin
MSTKWIIVIAVVVLAAVGGALALSGNNKSDNSTSTPTSKSSTSNSSSSSSTPSATSDQNSGATITYSNNGFSPSTLTVKAGTKITIKNTSSEDMQFDSDPHPAHTDDTELNVGIVSPGESMTFTVTTTGTHGYHNHLDPSDTGTIIVQ